ncbi:MAG: hypothetical protein IT244_04185 [Bacteroidia bacterium]|nr:hypothetical protein [Bacteroidia bacterium]
MKATAIASICMFIMSCTFTETAVPTFSDLQEWGLAGNVKQVKALYYKSVKQVGEDLVPINPAQWDRMTVTYYNPHGMLDSIKSYTPENPVPLTYTTVHGTAADTTYFISKADTQLYSIKQWKSKLNYTVKIITQGKVEAKENTLLDETFKIKEIHREQYDMANSSVLSTSGEHMYFNKQHHLDSIREFSNNKMQDLIVNVDLTFDSNNNPTKSSKKVGTAAPYLAVREFTYYK